MKVPNKKHEGTKGTSRGWGKGIEEKGEKEGTENKGRDEEDSHFVH